MSGVEGINSTAAGAKDLGVVAVQKGRFEGNPTDSDK